MHLAVVKIGVGECDYVDSLFCSIISAALVRGQSGCQVCGANSAVWVVELTPWSAAPQPHIQPVVANSGGVVMFVMTKRLPFRFLSLRCEVRSICRRLEGFCSPFNAYVSVLARLTTMLGVSWTRSRLGARMLVQHGATCVAHLCCIATGAGFRVRGVHTTILWCAGIHVHHHVICLHIFICVTARRSINNGDIH